MGNFVAPLVDEPANGDRPPDWIDYRASVARAARRADAGETVPTCEACGTELDVDDVVHSPLCAGETGTAPARNGRGVSRWNRESVEAAIQAWAAEHGRPPKQKDTNNEPGLPSPSSVRDTHGSWANAVEAAGFPRPRRGGHSGPLPPGPALEPSTPPLEALPKLGDRDEMAGWRDRLLAEADRCEQIARGYRLIEQGLALVEASGGEVVQ
jgi:hypothetical protein